MFTTRKLLKHLQYNIKFDILRGSNIKCVLDKFKTPQLSHRNYTTFDIFRKITSKLVKQLKNINSTEFYSLNELLSHCNGEYDEELFTEIKKELLDLYYDSYLNVEKSIDPKLTKLKSNIKRMRSSLFSGDLHRVSDCHKVLLQVKGGVGGEESSRFASELFGMYRNISDIRNLKFIRHNDTSAEVIGGLDFFKYEFGVHRVQRIPVNCKRIQTSSASVTVVPHFDIENVKLKSTDLMIETMRSSGSGGQSVNKSETAVRVTHLPTGISVQVQDTSSQIDNKQSAIEQITRKIREKQRNELEFVSLEMEANRHFLNLQMKMDIKSSQVKTGDRSEKIRTLNFIHDTVVDHRCKVTLSGVDLFLECGESIDVIHSSLSEFEDFTILNFMIDNMEDFVYYYDNRYKYKHHKG